MLSHFSCVSPHGLEFFCSWGFSRATILEWVAVSPLGDFPDLGIEPVSLTSPALACRLITTSITWENHPSFYPCGKPLPLQMLLFKRKECEETPSTLRWKRPTVKSVLFLSHGSCHAVSCFVQGAIGVCQSRHYFLTGTLWGMQDPKRIQMLGSKVVG